MNSPTSHPIDGPALAERLLELTGLFSYLGIIGFGGPAAHIAMMEDEVVHRRQWLTRDHFLDLVGATNLIPGPNSTEMAIHIGYLYAGFPGLLVAGLAFIAPALAITTTLAWAYSRFGSLPQVEPFLFGIKPAVLAIILGAVLKLGRPAYKGWRLGLIGLAVFAASLLGVNPILALLVGALAGMFFLRWKDFIAGSTILVVIPFTTVPYSKLMPLLVQQVARVTRLSENIPLLDLGLYFLRIGAVLYGSGYVLVAFLEGGLVQELGWLSQSQLLDAISAGQLTPGPVLSTSAFIGYQLAGLPGALISAAAIFAPSFMFVLILNPLIPKLRQSRWTAAFLDAANISAVALMAAVVIQLGADTLVDWQAWLIALGAAYLRLVRGWSPSLLVPLAALGGWLLLLG